MRKSEQFFLKTTFPSFIKTQSAFSNYPQKYKLDQQFLCTPHKTTYDQKLKNNQGSIDKKANSVSKLKMIMNKKRRTNQIPNLSEGKINSRSKLDTLHTKQTRHYRDTSESKVQQQTSKNVSIMNKKLREFKFQQMLILPNKKFTSQKFSLCKINHRKFRIKRPKIQSDSYSPWNHSQSPELDNDISYFC